MIGRALVVAGLAVMLYEVFLTWSSPLWFGLGVVLFLFGMLALAEHREAHLPHPYDWARDR